MPEDSEKEKLDQLRGLTDQAFEGIKAEMKRLKLDRGKAAYRRPLDLLEKRTSPSAPPSPPRAEHPCLCWRCAARSTAASRSSSADPLRSRRARNAATGSCPSACTAGRRAWRWRTSTRSPPRTTP